MGIQSINLKGVRSASPFIPLDRHVTIYGDSRTANCHGTVTAGENVENYGYAAWMALYADSRVRTTKARNGGVGGDTSAQWLARLPTVLAYG
jgi:lysophospholipase L1-like esterase